MNIPEYCQIDGNYLGISSVDKYDKTKKYRKYDETECIILGGISTSTSDGYCLPYENGYNINFSEKCKDAPPKDFFILKTPSSTKYLSNKCAANTELINNICNPVDLPFPCSVDTTHNIINDQSYCLYRANKDYPCIEGIRYLDRCVVRGLRVWPESNRPPCPENSIRDDKYCLIHDNTTCYDGTVYNSTTHRCIGVPVCGDNTTVDPETNRCRSIV